jgi:hypothetical protein
MLGGNCSSHIGLVNSEMFAPRRVKTRVEIKEEDTSSSEREQVCRGGLAIIDINDILAGYVVNGGGIASKLPQVVGTFPLDGQYTRD